jgi:hypothetical protein
MRNGARAARAGSARAGRGRLGPGFETRARLGAWTDALARETRQRPGRSVAIALGVGYVLGGGLASRLTARIVGAGIRVGLRMVLLPFVTESIAALAQGQTNHKET